MLSKNQNAVVKFFYKNNRDKIFSFFDLDF
jgi:hypothetical protein